MSWLHGWFHEEEKDKNIETGRKRNPLRTYTTGPPPPSVLFFLFLLPPPDLSLAQTQEREMREAAGFFCLPSSFYFFPFIVCDGNTGPSSIRTAFSSRVVDQGPCSCLACKCTCNPHHSKGHHMFFGPSFPSFYSSVSFLFFEFVCAPQRLAEPCHPLGGRQEEKGREREV